MEENKGLSQKAKITITVIATLLVWNGLVVPLTLYFFGIVIPLIDVDSTIRLMAACAGII